MTVVEKARPTAPRSALRYRSITTGLEPSSQAIIRARKSRADVHVTTAPAAPDDLDQEDEHLQRPRRTALVRQTHTKHSVHPLLFIGLSTLITLLLWIGVTQLLAWGTKEYNTLVYGSPRTFQVDAIVGQGDSQQHPSHFESLNLHGVVTILEFPAGDVSHVRVLATYTVSGPDADQAVAMMRFFDVNHNGKPDMLVDIGRIQLVLVNDQGTFRTPTPVEQQQIFQDLQQSSE